MKKIVEVFLCFLLTFFQAGILFCFLPTLAVQGESDCRDLKVIFNDGSGATIDGTNNDYLDFKEAVSGVLDRTKLSYEFYELGSQAQGGYQYPATAIGIESVDAFITTIGAKISAGKSYAYGESFRQGLGELKTYLRQTLTECKNTKFVLAGFSQGAGILTMGMPELAEFKNNIIYIATFGDAKLYLPEGSGVFPSACRLENLSEYREFVPDCETVNGILGGQVPYVAEGFEGKVGVWCNHFDMICTSRINWFNLNESMDPHGSYGNSRYKTRTYYLAAEKIYEKVLEAFGLEKPVVEKEKKVHNVAILIDTTGSMKNLIGQYKKEALRLSKEVLGSENGKVAIYEYRDLKEDNFQPILHCDFETCTLEKIEEILEKLETDGGGDDPESLLSASLQAMNELKWEQGATKSIVALTDAGYHKTEIFGEKQIGIEEVKLRSLEIDPVNIYTITPEEIMPEYLELTEETGGKSFSATGELNFSTDYIVGRPNVKLKYENYYGTVRQKMLFDASDSSADGKILKYEWDLDFDGAFETETDGPIVEKVYDGARSGFVQVKVTDENGFSGTMSARVEISERIEKSSASLEIEDFSVDKTNNEVEIDISTNGFRTLVYLNEVLIGVSSETKVRISDLDFSRDNKISLVPYGKEVNSIGEGRFLTLRASKDKTDKTTIDKNEESKSENSDKAEEKEYFIYPKNPDCGTVKKSFETKKAQR